MQRLEELLRDQLRQTNGSLPVTRDAMLARVAKVRRRRAGIVAAGLTVLAVSGAAALTGMLGPRIGQQFGSDQPVRQYSAQLLNVVFTDPQHGFVLQRLCSEDVVAAVPDDAPTPDVHRDCTSQLLVTADAGQSWQERALPGEPATKDADVELISGHSLMLWVDGPGTVAMGGWNRRYWTTADGALTWTESATPRDTGPAGSLATFDIGGRLTFLASYPPGGANAIGDKSPLTAATDGSFWVRCTSSPCVRVTRDHGQTWQANPVEATAVDWVSTLDGVTVFAGVRSASGQRLIRSADGGVTWSDVVTLAQTGAGGLALANGDVIIAQSGEVGGLLRFKAGTTALEPLPGALARSNTLYVSAGVVVAARVRDWGDDPEFDSIVSISPDHGTTWIPVPPPA